MRVRVHPADLGGCGYYRLIWCSEALAAQGHDVEVLYDYTYSCSWIDTIAGPRLVGIEDDLDFDVVVLQRPLTRNRLQLVEAFQARGVAVVVEIDDDFHAIHPRNPAWKGTNPLTNVEASRDWLMRACDRADLVTCTTPALAERYGSHGRVAILDNYVPARYCRLPRKPHDGVEVGWSGSTLTHPGDLEVTKGAVAQAVEQSGARLGVVGTGVGFGPCLGYAGEVHATGWVVIEEYPAALTRFDVGIVPLKAIPFNEAKSHLKGIEMASVGVPFVATPTGPYRALADAGIGWLADSPAAWREYVTVLATDHGLRADLSARWRAEVAENWTVEQNAWRWWDAWEVALVNSRERVAA